MASRKESRDYWDNCECPPEKCDHGLFVSLPGETYTSLAAVEIRRTTERTDLPSLQEARRRPDCECSDLSDLGNEDDCSCPEESSSMTPEANSKGNGATARDNCKCDPRGNRVMPDFAKLRFVSDNPKTRTYQMMEFKRCEERNIQNRFPTLLTNQFELLGRQEFPVEDPPYEAWEIRHRRNPELLETPGRGGVTLPYENALPTFMYVPIANFGTRVAGALFDENADHRIKKTALRAMND